MTEPIASKPRPRRRRAKAKPAGAIGPPSVRIIRRMLQQRRAQGTGGRKALVFAVATGSPGLKLPQSLEAMGESLPAFVIQHIFWDLEDCDDLFKVTLSIQGVQEELVIPYDSLTDFYEYSDPPEAEQEAPYSSSDIPVEVEAIRDALAIKAALGPGGALGIQLRIPVERATFEPVTESAGGSDIDLIIDHNYWNLILSEDGFEIIVADGLNRTRISVPYDAVEEAHAFSFMGEDGPARLGRQVTTLTSEEMADPEESTLEMVGEFMSGLRPALAVGLLLTSVVVAAISAALVYFASTRHGVAPNHIVFFSYVSPNMMASFEAGHVELRTLLSDLPLIGGLGALWSATLALMGLAALLPMRSDQPMHMQASITGFFYAYVITLLIYGGFTISYTYVPGLLRVFWIMVLFALCERVKWAVPARWSGAQYFPQVVDGLFAIGATLIIAQGMDTAYDQALSGPVFVLIYFGVMLLFGRRMVRSLLMRQLARTYMVPDVEPPSEEDSRTRQISHVTKAVFGQLRRKRERLTLLSFEELLAEYQKEFSEGRKLMSSYRWRDAKPTVAAGSFALMLIWTGCVLLAAWAATNANLYIFGVGR